MWGMKKINRVVNDLPTHKGGPNWNRRKKKRKSGKNQVSKKKRQKSKSWAPQ